MRVQRKLIKYYTEKTVFLKYLKI